MSAPPLRILKSCHISNQQVLVNGQPVFVQEEGAGFKDFAAAAYRFLHLEYPKFFKMDNLSKLGFLASEFLLDNAPVQEIAAADKTGLVITTCHSSTDTDLRYFLQVQEGVASPAQFVYTLPNIVLGEICIRNGFKGENTCFVEQQYEPEVQVPYVQQLFAEGAIDACLAGWVDFLQNEYKAFLLLVAPSADASLPEFTISNTRALF